MNDFSERVAASIGRHFVMLSCLKSSSSSEKAEVLIFSGFVVDVLGEWFYVTAGHVPKGIGSMIEDGYTFDTWRLNDQAAGKQFEEAAIPFDFQFEHWCVVEDASVGLDYAAVPLGGLYRQQLEVGGVVPFTKEAWGDYIADHDYWTIVGVPSESISENASKITAQVVIIPLSPANPPRDVGQKAENQFYAKLMDGSEEVVNNISGMSGGPIISLREVDSVWKYKVIGIQSGWYSDSRILAACPFSSFAEALERAVEEAIAEQTRTH
ncbi:MULTISPECIES: hypothetical protein [unclassified Pseudomonas]|uniref:hypothetical protein n=1 Tax=unclassified Pseudomonas TaxID=196821 RepID=UPI001A9DCAB1|nr:MULTISPECIES: hypothetical protein [unclassified Pseudomonas]